jgi:hypothetical protein
LLGICQADSRGSDGIEQLIRFGGMGACLDGSQESCLAIGCRMDDIVI